LIEVDVLFSSSTIGTQILLHGEDGDILIDAGDGVLRDLISRRYDFSRLKGILITHEHIDHFCGLLSLYHFLKQLGYDASLKVVTPSGGGEISKLLSLSDPSPKLEIEKATAGSKISIGSFLIEPFNVDHTCKEAVGYTIFDKKGRKIVISGDTRACSELEKQLVNAELAILDATFPSGMEQDACLHGHMTEDQALNLARSANRTILIHKMDLTYYKKMSCRFGSHK
jgi:ribonuclease Z